MRTSLAVVLFAAAGLAAAVPEGRDLSDMFASFRARFGKRYAGTEEGASLAGARGLNEDDESPRTRARAPFPPHARALPRSLRRVPPL